MQAISVWSRPRLWSYKGGDKAFQTVNCNQITQRDKITAVVNDFLLAPRVHLIGFGGPVTTAMRITCFAALPRVFCFLVLLQVANSRPLEVSPLFWLFYSCMTVESTGLIWQCIAPHYVRCDLKSATLYFPKWTNCLCRRTFAYAAPFVYDSCVHRREENSYCDYYFKDVHSMGSNYLRKLWFLHAFWKETSYSADFLLTKACNENILWIKITFQRKHVNNFI